MHHFRNPTDGSRGPSAASGYAGTMNSVPAYPEDVNAREAGFPAPTVEILDHVQVPSAWSTFHRIRYRIRRADGAWLAQEREFLDRGDAIALLPFCAETANVLLTRQFRMPVYLRHPAESMLVECCGGILDNADPEVTVSHEAIEELGIELNAVEKVFEGHSTPGSVCEKVHYYIAPYTAAQRRYPGGGNLHEGEDIEILETPLSEALNLIRTHEIRDVRTIALILYLAASGFPGAA